MSQPSGCLFDLVPQVTKPAHSVPDNDIKEVVNTMWMSQDASQSCAQPILAHHCMKCSSSPIFTIELLFCSVIKWINPKIYMLFFVLLNRFHFNLLCVWILLIIIYETWIKK